MKKKKGIPLKSVLAFIVTFLIYHLAVGRFFPVDENNVLQAPDWYPIVGIILSITAAYFCSKPEMLKKRKFSLSEFSFNLLIIISVFSGFISIIGLIGLINAERVPRSFVQVFYMFSLLIGGIFGTLAKKHFLFKYVSCISYSLGFSLSVIISLLFRDGIHTDSIFLFFVLIINIFLIFYENKQAKKSKTMPGSTDEEYGFYYIEIENEDQINRSISVEQSVVKPSEIVCQSTQRIPVTSTTANIDLISTKQPVEIHKEKEALEDGHSNDSVPKSEETVRELLVSAKFALESMAKTNHVAYFILAYDEVIEDFQKLVDMGVSPKELSHTPMRAIQKMEEEFQTRLFDVIERAKKRTIEEITVKYKNSKTLQEKCALDFAKEIKVIANRLSAGALGAANSAGREIFETIGIDWVLIVPNQENIKASAPQRVKARDPMEIICLMEAKFEERYKFCYEHLLNLADCQKMYNQTIKEFDSINLPLMAQVRFEQLCAEYKEKFNITNPFLIVDAMEGHDFEKWCAELLKKNGFTDVEVTKGSGDQGVDVLAIKDGIKYAIQCKCYSSNLGNTPVQEVNAGKTMYGCQIGVVMTNRYFTSGAKDLAKATGVLLWDRDKLKSFLESSN